jgi:hypothetical protein
MGVNTHNNPTAWVAGASVEAVNDNAPIWAGQLGSVVTLNTKAYMYVQLDSGATSTAAIAPAANQVLFWKDRATNLVTNDSRFSTAGRNGACGILRYAATAGNYTYMQIRGIGNVKTQGTTGTVSAGDFVFAYSGTAADATNVAGGSTTALYKIIGIAQSASVSTTTSVDLQLDDNV